MKFSIIGLGFISTKHIEAIRFIGGEIVAGCDIEKKETEFPFFFDWKEMIDKVETDYVVVCTPNDLHYKMCRYAESKGKKVICEKPIALSSKGISKLKNTYAVLQLRYHPVLKEITQKENYGNLFVQVKRDKAYWDGWKGDTKRSGGLLMNIGIHYLDALLVLFGKKYNVERAEETERIAQGVLTFPRASIYYRMEIGDVSRRDLVVCGKTYSFSQKDNLAQENLHIRWYEELARGRGIPASEAVASLKLIEAIRKK